MHERTPSWEELDLMAAEAFRPRKRFDDLTPFELHGPAHIRGYVRSDLGFIAVFALFTVVCGAAALHYLAKPTTWYLVCGAIHAGVSVFAFSHLIDSARNAWDWHNNRWPRHILRSRKGRAQ